MEASCHRHDISDDVWHYWSRICQGSLVNGVVLQKTTVVLLTLYFGSFELARHGVIFHRI